MASKVQWGKKLAQAVKEASSAGVKKTKIRELLEVSGIAVSIGVGAFTLWRNLATEPVDEAMLQKRIDEMKIIDKDLEKKIANVVTQINTMTKDRQAELQKEKILQFGIIGGMFAIIGLLIYFVLSKRRR